MNACTDASRRYSLRFTDSPGLPWRRRSPSAQTDSRRAPHRLTDYPPLWTTCASASSMTLRGWSVSSAARNDERKPYATAAIRWYWSIFGNVDATRGPSWPSGPLAVPTTTSGDRPLRGHSRRELSRRKSADLAGPHRIGAERTGPSETRPARTRQAWTQRARTGHNPCIYRQLRSFIRSDPARSRTDHGSPPASRSASDDDEQTRPPCVAERQRRHAQTPDPARRDGRDRPVPLRRLRADGRVPLPEADPRRRPGRPLGRAGSARLHRQPSPSRLGSPPRIAEDERRSTRSAA